MQPTTEAKKAEGASCLRPGEVILSDIDVGYVS